MVLAEGDELDGGKYRIVRLLGHGGMGAVFEALDTVTQKRVAIKCLHPRRQGEGAHAERLVREARAAARVRHRNVVEVFDVRREGDVLFLVMALLEGETLRAALARRDLSDHVLIALLLQAMRGVAAAHKQGVVHRDIKPENLFLAREEDEREPVMKVLDFGISKLDADEAQLTATGAPIGTPAYMPLEQLSGSRDIDGRADVYAFGVVLYEALTGRVPYAGDGVAQVCCSVLEGKVVPPNELRPDLPDTLSRVVMWALRQEREQRVASMQQLIRELEPFSTLRGMQAERDASADEFEAPARVAMPAVAASAAEAASLARPSFSSASGASSTKPSRVPSRRRWLGALSLSAAALLVFALGLAQRAPSPVAAPAPRPESTQPAQVQPSPSAPSVLAPPAQSPAAPFVPTAPEGPRADSQRRKGIATPRAHHSADAASASAAEGPAMPSALGQAMVRRAAKIQQLKEQLVACDELTATWLRKQCRDDHKREIAEYEEQRELLEPTSDR